MNVINKATIFIFMGLFSGCASLPNSPSVMVLPGSGLSFDQFRNDDAICKQYAYFQVSGVSSNQFPTSSTVGGAAIGTALGAVTGAAIGGGTGAAIGAGSGLVAGGLVGAKSSNYSSYYANQQQYDAAYVQCMYAKGHQVPVRGQFSGGVPQHLLPTQAQVPPPPPPASSINSFPPPPVGAPPPPPNK